MSDEIITGSYTLGNHNDLFYREDSSSNFFELEKLYPMFSKPLNEYEAENYCDRFEENEINVTTIKNGSQYVLYVVGDKKEFEKVERVLEDHQELDRNRWFLKGDNRYNFSQLTRIKFPWGSLLDYEDPKTEEITRSSQLKTKGQAEISQLKEEGLVSLDIEVENWQSESDPWEISMAALKNRDDSSLNLQISTYQMEDDEINPEGYQVPMEFVDDELELLKTVRDYINQVDPLFILEYSDYDIKKLAQAAERYPDFEFDIGVNGKKPINRGSKSHTKVYSKQNEEEVEHYQARYKIPGRVLINPVPILQYYRPFWQNYKLETAMRSIWDRFEKMFGHEELETAFHLENVPVKQIAEYNFIDVIALEDVYQELEDVLLGLSLTTGETPGRASFKKPNLLSQEFYDKLHFEKNKTHRYQGSISYQKELSDYDWTELSQSLLEDLDYPAWSELTEVDVYYFSLIPKIWRDELEQDFPILYDLADEKQWREKVDAYRSIEGLTKELRFDYQCFIDGEITNSDFEGKYQLDPLKLKKKLDRAWQETKQELEGENLITAIDGFLVMEMGSKAPEGFVRYKEGNGFKIGKDSLTFSLGRNIYERGMDTGLSGDLKTEFERKTIQNFRRSAVSVGKESALSGLHHDIKQMFDGIFEREFFLMELKAKKDPSDYSDAVRNNKRMKLMRKFDLEAGDRIKLGAVKTEQRNEDELANIVGTDKFLNEPNYEVDYLYYINKLLTEDPSRKIIKAVFPGLEKKNASEFVDIVTSKQRRNLLLEEGKKQQGDLI